MPNISKAICSGSVLAASWRSSIAWRTARFSVSIQVRWPPASMSRTGPGLSSNSAAPPIIGQPPGSSADSVQSSQFTNIARKRGRPRGFAIAGWNTTSPNCAWPWASTASRSSSREPKWANRPDFDMPVASASVPMVRPSSPALLTRRSATSRIAARVRSPFVAVGAPAEEVLTAFDIRRRIVRTFVFVNQGAQLGRALLGHQGMALLAYELAVRRAVFVPAALRARQQAPAGRIGLAPREHIRLVQLGVVVRIRIVERVRGGCHPYQKDDAEPDHEESSGCLRAPGVEGQGLADPGPRREARRGVASWGGEAQREPPATSPRRPALRARS